MKKDKTEHRQGTKAEDVPVDNDRRAGSGRRRLLTTLGLGGSAAFLPTMWHKPVVQSLLLPAHAQTSGGPVSFADPCVLTLEFIAVGVGIGGCNGNAYTEVIPTISGDVVGEGDLSGIEIDIVSMLSGGSPPTQTLNDSVATDNNGHYEIRLDGLNGHAGSFAVCTDGRTGQDNCESDYPTGGMVSATVSSSNPRLSGQFTCSANFDCTDLANPSGSTAENNSPRSNTFYVELEPIDPTSTTKT